MTETGTYSVLEKDLAHFARAIGHPARVAVLMVIVQKGNHVMGEIPDVPSLSKSTVLQHLRELKRAGIIQGRIFGAKSEYSIDMQNFEKMGEAFRIFLAVVQSVKASQEKN